MKLSKIKIDSIVQELEKEVNASEETQPEKNQSTKKDKHLKEGKMEVVENTDLNNLK